LPLFDGIEWMDEHDNVQCEVVSDHCADDQLHGKRQNDGEPHGQAGRGVKANGRGDDVADRIDDAVTKIIQSDRGFAVAADDEVGVLEDFPGAFDHEGKAKAQGDRPFFPDEPEQGVEKEAMDDVGGRVPVTEMLGIFRTHHHSMPELDVATFADGFTAHRQENDSDEQNNASSQDWSPEGKA
jgi:hypothetical protein